jgi:26S proteasome regulatory subunit N7
VYSVLAGSVSLKRVDFKSKVVDAPEIRAILGDGEDKLSALSGALSAGPGADEEMNDVSSAAPAKTAVNLTTLGSSASDQPEVEAAIDFTSLSQLVSSLYTGSYKNFFVALAAVEVNFLSQDRYLYEHRAWFVREMRLRAYQQLLQSYRVVGLESMANDFGVTVDFLDRYNHPLSVTYIIYSFALGILQSLLRQIASPALLTGLLAKASLKRTAQMIKTSSTRRSLDKAIS